LRVNNRIHKYHKHNFLFGEVAHAPKQTCIYVWPTQSTATQSVKAAVYLRKRSHNQL